MDREPSLGRESFLNGSHKSLMDLLPTLATLIIELKAIFLVNIIISSEIVAMSAGLLCCKKITQEFGYKDCQQLEGKSQNQTK